MTASTSSAQRDVDKLGGNHFLLEIKGVEIGAFTTIEGLQMEREVLEYAEGGVGEFVHKLPGQLKYPNLTLGRGITNQDELQKWFLDCANAAQLHEITVTLVDSAQQPQRTWAFADAFPVKWQGPKLAADADSAATEQLEVAHRGLVIRT